MRNIALKSRVKSLVVDKEILLAEQFMYGHREILVDCLGFDRDTLFLGRLQHGWDLYPDQSSPHWNYPIFKDPLTQFPHLVWSKQTVRHIEKYFKGRALPISSPWSLLVKQNETGSTSKRRFSEVKDSVLYFPGHTYPGVRYEVVNSGIFELLKQTDASRVTTCLYWLDFVNPDTRRFYEEFSTVACCGYRGSNAWEAPWSPDGGRERFLYELFRLISSHELIVCDDVSTAFAASASLGKRVMLGRRSVIADSAGTTGIVNSRFWDNLETLKMNYHWRNEYRVGDILETRGELQDKAKEGFGFSIPEEETRETLTKLVYRSELIKEALFNKQ